MKIDMNLKTNPVRSMALFFAIILFSSTTSSALTSNDLPSQERPSAPTDPHQLLFDTEDYVIYGDQVISKAGLFEVVIPKQPWLLSVNASHSWDNIYTWHLPLYSPRSNGIVGIVGTRYPGFLVSAATLGEIIPRGMEGACLKAWAESKMEFIGKSNCWDGPSSVSIAYGVVGQQFTQQPGQMDLSFQSLVYGLHNISYSLIFELTVTNQGDTPRLNVPFDFHIFVGHRGGNTDTYARYEPVLQAVLTNTTALHPDYVNVTNLAIGFKGATTQGWQFERGTAIGDTFINFNTPPQLRNNTSPKDTYLAVILQHNVTLAPNETQTWHVILAGGRSECEATEKLVQVRKLDLETMKEETINYYRRKLENLIGIRTGYPIIDALLKIALYELYGNSENEWKLLAGPVFWEGAPNCAGMYTRDAAFSSYLMPYYNQSLLIKSILSRTADGFIIQDGQAWNEPDAIITVSALWRLYLCTNNLTALEYFYPFINKTFRYDYGPRLWLRDREDNLVYGLSGHPNTGDDWRIEGHTIKNLRMNLLYATALSSAMKIARLLGHQADYQFYNSWREEIIKHIDKFYRDGKWIYAFNATLTIPRDNVGAIALLADEYGINATAQLHLQKYGIPYVYPAFNESGQRRWKDWYGGSYAFITSHMTVGAAKLGMVDLVRENLMRSVYWRSVQMTHADYVEQDDFYYSHYGLSGGAPAQSWSAAGFLSEIVLALAGLIPTEAGIRVTPCLPETFPYIRITRLPFRGSYLNITIMGCGTVIKKIRVDGKNYKSMILPLGGNHDVEVYMKRPKKHTRALAVLRDNSVVVALALFVVSKNRKSMASSNEY